MDPEKSSGRILRFVSDPDPESLVILGSSRSLRDLYECHCLSTNIAEFWSHRRLSDSEQQSDSQI